jgi:hypothetical protein
MKEYFKSLSHINNAPIPITFNTDIPTQRELNFINEKCKFWIKNTILYCLQEPVTKNAFFSHNHPQLLELVLLYMAINISNLSTAFLTQDRPN